MTLAYLGLPQFWYDAEEDELANAMFSHVESIESDQSHVYEANVYHATMYSGRDELGIKWGNRGRTFNFDSNGLKTNIVKQVIDTACSMIAKNKPKIRVLTSGGKWMDQRRAKKLEKYIWGEFNARRVYDLAPDVFRDALVYGTGAMKVFSRHGKVCAERVNIDEIIVDEMQCMCDEMPREIFQRKIMDIKVLAALYPTKEEEIRTAAGSMKEWAAYREVPDGHCLVLEGWRLPDGPKSPGRHSIVAPGVVLLDEKWHKPTTGLIWFRWAKPLTGFYGQGVAEELADLQRRLLQLDRFIQRCQDLISVPRVFVDVSAKVLKYQLDTRIGAIIPFRGRPPTFFSPQAVSQEVYSERDRIIRQAFERIGISQLSAQSLKPAGLESAVALREFTSIGYERFSLQSQRYEEFFRQVAREFITCAREVYKGQGGKAKFTAHNLIEHIDWKEVDMEEDRFALSVDAASILTMSPAARLQTVTELAQVGQLDKQEIRYLLNHPDLERSNTLDFADWSDIERVLERLEMGEIEVPNPLQNLQLGMKRVQLAALKARGDGAPEEILENYRTWLSQAQESMDMAKQQAMAEQQAMAAAQQPQPASQGQPMTAEQAAAAGGAPIEAPIGATPDQLLT